MRPLLVYNGGASGAAKAYSLGANSLVQIGDNIGTNDTLSGLGTSRGLFGHNICQIQNTIYVLHNRTVKKKNSDGSWSTVFSLTSPYTSSDLSNRMIPCVIAGITYIVVLYASSASSATGTQFRAAVYNTQTGVVSTTASVGGLASGSSDWNPANISVGVPIYYDGVVYTALAVNSGNIAFLATINVQSASLSISAVSAGNIWGGNGRNSFCIFNNELWLLCTNGTGAGANYILYKLVGSSFTSQYTVATLTVPSNTYSWKPLLFTDETYMYAICAEEVSSSITWRMYRCTSSSATQVTTSVLSGFSSQDRDSRWRFVCDQHNNPTNPELILIYQPTVTAGSANRFYEFTNSSTQLQYLGSAGDSYSAACIATPLAGGGELMFRDGEMHIEFIGEPRMSSTAGNMTLDFRIYESSVFPSGSQVHVKMFVADGNRVPTSRCRLANPSPSGSIENSYTLTGIECGSGTLYSVDWRAIADGFSAGDSVTVVASVSGVI